MYDVQDFWPILLAFTLQTAVVRGWGETLESDYNPSFNDVW